MDGPDVSVGFSGDAFNIREIETYIERYHPRATAIVRTAAERCLAEFPDANVSAYLPDSDGNRQQFSREGRQLTFTLPISLNRTVNVYSKHSDRIRFEVRYRQRRGTVGSTHEDRQIVPVLNRERQAYLLACEWQNVGRLLYERAQPELGDLQEFLSVIEAAAVKRGCSPASVIAELIISGGMEQRSDDLRSKRLLRNDLAKRGILMRQLVTERGQKNRPVWFALRGPYEELCRKLRRGFVGQ